MANITKSVKLRKMNQRLEAMKKTDPERARKLEGKIAYYKGQKSS